MMFCVATRGILKIPHMWNFEDIVEGFIKRLVSSWLILRDLAWMEIKNYIYYMIQFLFSFADWGFLALRVVLGVILIANGLPKLKNLKATAKSFSSMGFRPGMFWGALVALLEFAGGIALIVGFLTQIISLLLVIQFLVILVVLKRKEKFGEKDFDLLILGALLVLLTVGGGAYSLDEYYSFILY